jgi:hypothetical protein
MTDEKKHVDLSKIEPIVHGGDPQDVDAPETREDVDRVGTAAAAAAGSTPAVGVLAETDDEAPPDPDDLDRLRRG